ncbi:MAG: OmpA family protein [Burkholderiaceae bacterium]
MANSCLRYTVFALVLSALAGCQSPPPPKPAAFVPKPDRIVLMPQANGSPSAVVIRANGGAEAVLATPYATASVVQGGVQTSMSDAKDVQSRYKTLQDAMPPQRKSYLVYFETGGDRLTADSAQQFKEILREIAQRPAPEILVVGHTDTLGSDAVNDELSMQRARIVRAALIEQGIDPKRIDAVGRGKRELLVPTRDGVAEARNRRVEIQVR